MSLEIKKMSYPNYQQLFLFGRLDNVTVQELNFYFSKLEKSNFVLNLEGLVFISSSGLRCLSQFAKLTLESGRNFYLLSPQGMVKEVLEVSGFLSIFKETTQDGIAKKFLDK